MDLEQSATTTWTFLFTDLEGSTRLWQQHPEAMKTVLARHDQLLRSAIEAANGQIVKTTGDGFHAVFVSPQDGLRAAILAQQSLLTEGWTETGPLRVRMGLHMGEAQQRGGDYYGTAVNRAARLMAAANGGQVLLSAAVARAVAGQLPEGISLRDLGEHRLKDLLRPEHIFQLLHPQLQVSFPAIASLSLLPNNLPSQPTVFVGRQDELVEIHDLLLSESIHLLTLLGPGGTGKTRLALQIGAELADNFIDGTYFIDLAPIREPSAVMAAIARTIGIKESSNGSMLDDFKDQLRKKTMLLLLDNFEQVTAAAVQVAELLRFCPHLKLLVTSREALRVQGEYLYPVSPLGLPATDFRRLKPEELGQYEAIQLFIERAKAVRPDFALTVENAAAVAELCMRLDGLPLAIELAAARIRLFSPEALRQRLDNRFKLLRGGARDLPERQQTLRDTIDWSYDLLTDDEKTLLAVVSVFSGFTFAAVEAVTGSVESLAAADIDVIEGLFSLVDKSLVRLTEEDSTEARLRMLETIKAYAADRLRENSALHQAVCAAHAAYFAAFAQEQWQRMTGYDRERALADMAASIDNLNIAWRYWADAADLERLQNMVDALWLLYDGRGWYQATVALTSDLLELLSATPSSPEQAQQEIMLQTSLARALLAIKGYTAEVEAAYNRALTLCEGQGQIPQLFPVLRGLSSYYLYRAEYDKGAQIGRRILELAKRTDDDMLRIHGYLVLGANNGFLVSLQHGLEILDRGIALFERKKQTLRPFQLGNNPGIVCYTTSAFFLWWLGLLDTAVARANRALEAATMLNHPFTMAYTLFHTGNLHMWRGEIALARKQAEAMLQIAEEHGFQIWQSLATVLVGAAQGAMGQPEEGLLLIEQGFALYQGHTSPPVFFPMLTGIRAVAYAQAGQPQQGLDLVDSLVQEMGEEHMLRQQTPLMLLKGELLLAVSANNAPEATGIFRAVLDNVNNIGGKLLTLQAVTRLCKLELQEGNADESGRILAEIYDSFTEGLETADLKEARIVLDQWQDTA